MKQIKCHKTILLLSSTILSQLLSTQNTNTKIFHPTVPNSCRSTTVADKNPLRLFPWRGCTGGVSDSKTHPFGKNQACLNVAIGRKAILSLSFGPPSSKRTSVVEVQTIVEVRWWFSDCWCRLDVLEEFRTSIKLIILILRSFTLIYTTLFIIVIHI